MGDRVSMVLLGAVLIVAAVTDWRSGKVDNRLTYPAILIGIVWAVTWGAISAGAGGAATGLQQSLLGLGAAVIPFGIIFAAGGLGGGDVKLMAAVGAISASWQCVLATTLYAFIIAALMALFVMVRKGLLRKTASRLFGAALMASAKVKAKLGDASSPRIPFAVAIGAGGLLAGAEVLLKLPLPWSGFGP